MVTKKLYNILLEQQFEEPFLVILHLFVIKSYNIQINFKSIPPQYSYWTAFLRLQTSNSWLKSSVVIQSYLIREIICSLVVVFIIRISAPSYQCANQFMLGWCTVVLIPTTSIGGIRTWTWSMMGILRIFWSDANNKTIIKKYWALKYIILKNKKKSKLL